MPRSPFFSHHRVSKLLWLALATTFALVRFDASGVEPIRYGRAVLPIFWYAAADARLAI